MESVKRNIFLAGLLSLLIPGLGQLYNTQMKKGAFFILISLSISFAINATALMLSFERAVVVVVLILLFRLLVIIEAMYQANRIQKVQLGWFNKWYAYLFVALCYVGVSTVINYSSNRSDALRIPTPAMLPTIKVGDFIVADLQYYKSNDIKRGDIAIFHPPHNSQATFIERCVAIAGDTVEIRNGLLYINNTRFSDSSYATRTIHEVLPKDFKMEDIYPSRFNNIDHYGPLVVPSNKSFFLGDNRDDSFDSRFFGFVDNTSVFGKPKYVYFSWNSENDFPRFNRIGTKF